MLGNLIAAAAANRSIGIIMNLASGKIGHLRVEQGSEGAKHSALGLTAESEQDEVMTREQGIDDLGNDGIVVADDARKDLTSIAQLHREVFADLVFHVASTQTLLRER